MSSFSFSAIEYERALAVNELFSYSLSRKTVNARENFWNVFCFATDQMRDETAKDNRQTAAGISHDFIRNNELAFSSTRNLQFSLWISLKKLYFDHKPTPVTSQKPGGNSYNYAKVDKFSSRVQIKDSGLTYRIDDGHTQGS